MLMKSKFVLVLLLGLGFSGLLSAQSVVGTWKTIDDDTGKARSHVKIYKKGGKVYGKIAKQLDPYADPNAVCNECPSKGKFACRGQKILGLEIIKGLEKDGNDWEADDGILDPENGSVYDCKIWVDEDKPNELKVRGYLGFFYRTQTWYRVN